MPGYKNRAYDPKYIFGQMAVDWEERIDFAALRKKRMERAREKMKEHGLGALLLFRHDNIRYVTGLWGGMWQTGEKCFRYCILAGDGEPVMFEVPGVDLICQSQGAPWIKDFRPAMIWRSAAGAKEDMLKKFTGGILDVLKANGVSDMPVGVDMVDYAGFKALMDAGIQLADALPPLQEASMIKFPEELHILKQACAIQDAAFWRAREVIAPGLRETELKAAVVEVCYALGAERFEQVTLASGGRTNPFWRNGPSDKMLRYGDIILLDICMQYNGYNTCYYRNFVVGDKPTKKQQELFKRCRDSLYAAIERIKPGVSTAEIAAAWKEEEFKDSTYGSVSLLQFGHGVGISNHELPFISLAYSEENPVVLQQNMHLALETLYEDPNGNESARLEEQVVVTENGFEIFSLYPLYPGVEEDM